MHEGTQLDRFVLRAPIARTRHSVVWRAEDEHGQQVAIKVLQVGRAGAEPYRRFRDEIAFHLGHARWPGVLPLLAAYAPEELAEGERAWLAMPVAQTARDALDVEASLGDVVEAIAACAKTLASLARERIYHRDLKPSNLFYRDGAWLVGDFGLVTWPGKQELTESGDKLGPAHFIAPEMVTDPASAAPGPADVWSLAKTLWTLAVGQNFPPPGQLRVDEPLTRLREFVSDGRAHLLEPILEHATSLDPGQRPTMDELAAELEAWLARPVERTAVPPLEELTARVRAITAPAEREEEARLVRDKQIMDLFFTRLREDGLHRLYVPMEQLGCRVHVGDQSLVLHGLGGGSGRRDAIEQGAESLAAVPYGRHSVSLVADVAYQLFDDGLVHLVAGLYIQPGHELPEKLWIETRRVRLGTETAFRAADELGKGLTEQFPAAAARFAERLEQAEEKARRSRQPVLESQGDSYVFRTEPDIAGGIVVLRKEDGSRDGYAVAWIGTPLSEIRAEGDRLYVRTERNQGWITRSHKGTWSMSAAESLPARRDE